MDITQKIKPIATPYTVADLNGRACLTCGSPNICTIDGDGKGCVDCGQVYIPTRALGNKKEVSAPKKQTDL